MIESAVMIGGQSLVGILSEPVPSAETGLTVVFVNAGSTHRSGPNRLYTTLARRLTADGHRCLRFDLAGIGDSPSAAGLGKFRDYAARQVGEAMDYLGRTRGCREFVLLGLCGGADIAFDAAADTRVTGLILINGAFVDGDAFAQLYHKASRRTAKRFYASRLFSFRRWWRFVTFQSGFWKRLARHQKAPAPTHLPCGQMSESAAGADDARSKWTTLVGRQVRILLAYSQGSIFWDVFRSANREFLKAVYPNDRLAVTFHKNADHTFTLRSAQERLAIQIEQWLQGLSSNGSRATGSGLATGGQT